MDDLHVKFGRRRDDNQIIVGWRNERGHVEHLLFVDVRNVVGIELERIEVRLDGSQFAAVLASSEWGQTLYFLNRRPDWTKQQYFDFARHRREQLGIL